MPKCYFRLKKLKEYDKETKRLWQLNVLYDSGFDLRFLKNCCKQYWDSGRICIRAEN